MERPILTKLAIVMRMGPPDTVSKQKFTILKIQDGDGRHIEQLNKRNIFAPDWPIMTKFGTLMLWTLSTTIANKISWLQKSMMAAAAILKIWKIAMSPHQTTNFDDI